MTRLGGPTLLALLCFWIGVLYVPTVLTTEGALPRLTSAVFAMSSFVAGYALWRCASWGHLAFRVAAIACLVNLSTFHFVLGQPPTRPLWAGQLFAAAALFVLLSGYVKLRLGVRAPETSSPNPLVQGWLTGKSLDGDRRRAMAEGPQVGGVYSVVRGGGTYGAVKVIAHEAEENTIYARLYQALSQYPPGVDWDWFEDREPGSLDRELGVGIGALPITRRVFDFWQPVLLFSQAITDEERDDLRSCEGAAVPWDKLWYA